MDSSHGFERDIFKLISEWILHLYGRNTVVIKILCFVRSNEDFMSIGKWRENNPLLFNERRDA
jgi:hypothetical protein